jgi:hypothetical protein
VSVSFCLLPPADSLDIRKENKRDKLIDSHIDLDFATLQRELPANANIEPAYDGMTIAL